MPSPDARFLTLMTAIETLIRPEPRPAIARDFVTGLIAQAKAAELPRPQRDSILGSLEWLKSESISQAGRRLVATLGDRTYGQRTPSRFFTECYDLRSKLVHGSVPRPTFADVNGIVGELERLTRDLLVLGVLQLGD